MKYNRFHNPRLGFRYLVHGYPGGHQRRYFGAVAAAYESLLIGPGAVIAARVAPGEWKTIFSAHLDGERFPSVEERAAELDARRARLLAEAAEPAEAAEAAD